MTRTILATMLLTGCFRTDCDPQYRFVNELTGKVICTGPTGTVTASGPDDRDRARAETERETERPEKPEKEPETDRETEEDREEREEGY